MDVSTPAAPEKSQASLRVILWILVLLAAVEFIWRGPVRFLSGPSQWNDLSQNYTASKLWLRGKSPADPENFVALWKEQTRVHLDIDDIRTHLAPPLGGLVVLAPVAALPWKAAKFTWLVLLLISFAATVAALTSTAKFRWGELRTLAFLAACLALAPFQTGIGSVNTSILVIGLCAVAIWAAGNRRDATAGILFGLACAVKPQIGAFLVLYYLVRKRWKLFTTAVACTIALNLVAVLYLQLHATSWVQDYVHNAKGLVTANHIDDFTTANPGRFALINLQVPFFALTGHSSPANLLAFAVVAVLVCVWIYLVISSKDHTPELLSLAAISSIALLPVYHRFYDAALLSIPVCWCIANTSVSSRATARIALLLMIPFLFPGAAFLQLVAAHGFVPAAITHSWWWDTALLPHETWCLLVLGVFLLHGMRRSEQLNIEQT